MQFSFIEKKTKCNNDDDAYNDDAEDDGDDDNDGDNDDDEDVIIKMR